MVLSDTTPCTYCGMTGASGEYHPYGVCLMMKACNNSETVRANLAAMRDHFRAEARRDALEEAAKLVQNTDEWKNGKWTSNLCPTTKETIADAIRALKETIK